MRVGLVLEPVVGRARCDLGDFAADLDPDVVGVKDEAGAAVLPEERPEVQRQRTLRGRSWVSGMIICLR